MFLLGYRSGGHLCCRLLSVSILPSEDAGESASAEMLEDEKKSHLDSRGVARRARGVACGEAFSPKKGDDQAGVGAWGAFAVCVRVTGDSGPRKFFLKIQNVGLAIDLPQAIIPERTKSLKNREGSGMETQAYFSGIREKIIEQLGRRQLRRCSESCILSQSMPLSCATVPT